MTRETVPSIDSEPSARKESTADMARIRRRLLTIRLDCEAPVKVAIDTLAAGPVLTRKRWERWETQGALRVDDRHVIHLDVDKHRVHRRADQRPELRVSVEEGAQVGAS